MALDLINNLIAIIQIIVQFAVAFLSCKIYCYNRIRKAWLAVTVAFILMGLRRITALLMGMEYLPQLEGSLLWLDRIGLPFLISILLMCGFYSMLKQFESFKIIETKTTEKMKIFSKLLTKGIKKEVKK